MASSEKRLERYTLKHSEEVLLVKVQWADEVDEVTIFKGFSSSLMRQTAFDADEPVIPAEAVVLSIDRFRSPYDPSQPQVLEQGLSWNQFLARLEQEGL
jgi:hypothetical protein